MHRRFEFARPTLGDGTAVESVFPWYPSPGDTAGILLLARHYAIKSALDSSQPRHEWDRLTRVYRLDSSLQHELPRWGCRHQLDDSGAPQTATPIAVLAPSGWSARWCDRCFNALEELTWRYRSWNLLAACALHVHSLAYLQTRPVLASSESYCSDAKATARCKLAQRRVAWTRTVLLEELAQDPEPDRPLAGYCGELTDATAGVGTDPVELDALGDLADVVSPFSNHVWIDAVVNGADRAAASAACRWHVSWYGSDLVDSSAVEPPRGGEHPPGSAGLVYVAVTGRMTGHLPGNDSGESNLRWVLTGSAAHGGDSGADFFVCPARLADGLERATMWRSDVSIFRVGHPTARADLAEVCALAKRLSLAAGPSSYLRSGADAVEAAEQLVGCDSETLATALALAHRWTRPGSTLAAAARAICQ